MAAFNKFQDFVEQLGLAEHNLNTDALHVYLSNTTPSASLDAVKADLAEIGAGNGYTADGIDTLNTWAEAAGTGTLTGTKAVWTASGGSMATFQYVVLMNFTNAAPLKPLIGWWDYGSALTLLIGETFSVKFNNSETTGTILTIA
jgi:hypothetical protein